MLLLVAAMVVPTQAWADIEPSKPSGEGTSTSPYQISTAAELYWFAGLVNGDEKVCTGDVNRNLSACATLTADITVNSGVLKADGTLADDTSSFTEWTPMGDPPNQPYNGTFEGANHTISGLYFNNSTTNHVGLFGGICGTVMNVGVIDSYFKGQSYVGGVCGMIKNYGTITNCYNKGAVSGYREVGGVCGWMYSSSTITKSTITDCYNTGKVSGKEYVGGVCGSIAVYDSETATVTNCYNTGSVSGTSAVGGVCGINGAFFSNSTATVNKCYNTGAVSGSNEVGGVCGRNTTSPSYSTATVINCYNIGAVSGDREVGGVCGNSAPVYDPGQNNAYTYIKNCYNIGTVSGTSSVGGVCGSALFDFQSGTSYYSKIENCYYNTDIYSGYAVGNIVEGGTVCTKVEGKTSAKFRSGEVAYLLFYGNNDGVWGQAIGTESYPVLGGQTVYQFTPTCSSGSENKAYSNTYYQNNIPDHYYINGICSACGGYQPAQKNEEGYYEIDNAGQLFWFAGLVNGDTNVCDYNEETNASGTKQNKAAYAVLTANIVVNSGLAEGKTMLESLEYDASGNVTNGSNFVAWTPIENYTGTFDGQGYTVSGLYFNDSSKERVGLFGYVDSGGKISNVGVLDSYFQFRMRGGGICGHNKGEINNCTNGGTVIGNSTGSGAGGVCGMNYGTVKDCKNTGSVSGTVTGIGGVCGAFYSGSIENCLNEGTVSGTGETTKSAYGGVCGQAKGGVIKLSSNTASIRGYNAVGGVCGSNTGATLEDCYNTGAVIGTALSSFGGVCGSNSTGSIKNCYNTGAVSGNNNVGGVCGKNSGTITNCYYLSGTATGGINGEDATGSAESKSSTQFASGEVAYLLQNGQTADENGVTPEVWGQTIGTEDYPVLGGLPVYFRDEVYTNTYGILTIGTQTITASNEPLVWYEFTPSETGSYQFSSTQLTAGNLYVNTTQSESDYTDIATSPTYDLEAATTYYVAVSGAPGSYDLTITRLNNTPTAIETVTAPQIYAVDGRIVCEGEFRIYDLLGRDVTHLNGSLCGVYVVKTADAAQKVVVK